MSYVRSRASWPTWPDPNSLIRNTDLENWDATLLSHDQTLAAILAASGSNKVPVLVGSVWVVQQIDNNQIAAGAGILGSKLQFSKSAAPPGAPSDGDLWLLPADATNGVNWLFRYNAGSASAFKWEFVGGPPLVAEIDTAETFIVDSTFHDPATPGPSVTLPRAGDYDYLMSANQFSTGGASVQFLGLSIAGAAPVATGPDVVQNFSAGANQNLTGTKDGRLTGRAAADVLKLQYRANGAGATTQWRTLEVRPVRVS